MIDNYYEGLKKFHSFPCSHAKNIDEELICDCKKCNHKGSSYLCPSYCWIEDNRPIYKRDEAFKKRIKFLW